MALPTAEEITKLFLYGSATIPDLVDASRIRLTKDEVTRYVNVNEYMSGPGRFVNARSFSVVNNFLN